MKRTTIVDDLAGLLSEVYAGDIDSHEAADLLMTQLDRAGYIIMRRSEVAPEQPMYSCGHRHPNRVEAADCLRGQLAREALRG